LFGLSSGSYSGGKAQTKVYSNYLIWLAHKKKDEIQSDNKYQQQQNINKNTNKQNN
jgi:hypothetical protein